MRRLLRGLILIVVCANPVYADNILGLICDIPSQDQPESGETKFLDRDEARAMIDHPLNLERAANHPLYAANVFASLELDGEELDRTDPFGLLWHSELLGIYQLFDEYLDRRGYDKETGELGQLLSRIRQTLRSGTGDSTREQPKDWASYRTSYNDVCTECGLARSTFPFNKVDISDFNIDLPCEEIAVQKEAMAVYHMSNTVYQYAGLRNEVFKTTEKEVRKSYESRRQKLVNGLPMWPWETYVNGYGRFKADQSRRVASQRQLLFFRPSIAPALKFSGSDDSQLDAALLVELGMIKYKAGSEFNEWSGWSLIATVTNDNGAGYGAAYRKNNWLVGAARHSQDDEWLLYASIDLYELLTSEESRTTSADAFLSDFREYLVDKELDH